MGRDGPFALDFSAIMITAQARGVDTALLASVLPHVERPILAAWLDKGTDE